MRTKKHVPQTTIISGTSTMKNVICVQSLRHTTRLQADAHVKTKDYILTQNLVNASTIVQMARITNHLVIPAYATMQSYQSTQKNLHAGKKQNPGFFRDFLYTKFNIKNFIIMLARIV